MKSNDIPYASTIQLETTSLNQYFSGIEKKYGQDIPVDLGFKVLNAGHSSIQNGTDVMEFNASISTQIIVAKEIAVELTLDCSIPFTIYKACEKDALSFNY